MQIYSLSSKIFRTSSIISTILTTLSELISPINVLFKASKKYGISEIAIGGGVAANSYLRSELHNISKTHNWNIYFPKMEYCTDNAAMIANYAYYMFMDDNFSNIDVVPFSRI